MTGNLGARSFAFANFRYQRGVGLHFAVEVEFYAAVFQDLYSLTNFVDGIAGAAAHGGVGQEGNARS